MSLSGAFGPPRSKPEVTVASARAWDAMRRALYWKSPSRRRGWIRQRALRRVRREAREIVASEFRIAVVRLRRDGHTWKEIAALLGRSSAASCTLAYETACRAYAEESRYSGRPLDPEWWKMSGPSSRSHARSTALVHVPGPTSTPGPAVTGTVVDPPSTSERARLRRQILDLRKRALDYEAIAEHLGISFETARDLGKQALRMQAGDEYSEVELARRLQIEQVDAMIQGIYPRATAGIYDAIDRMVKLLDHKGKLLGLQAPMRIDIDARLVILAEQMGADLDEIREIAADVLKELPRS